LKFNALENQIVYSLSSGEVSLWDLDLSKIVATQQQTSVIFFFFFEAFMFVCLYSCLFCFHLKTESATSQFLSISK